MPDVKRRFLLTALLCLLAGPPPSYGQTGRGVLSGVVLNSNGKPVASARVYFQDADGKSPHLLRTDAQGRFHSGLLRASLYDVRAEAGGRWSEWAHNVVVRGGSDQIVTLRLLRATSPER